MFYLLVPVFVALPLINHELFMNILGIVDIHSQQHYCRWEWTGDIDIVGMICTVACILYINNINNPYVLVYYMGKIKSNIFALW